MNWLKCCMLTLTAVLLGVLLCAPAMAADSDPQIVLSETGVAHQYKITLERWSSSANSVQFDIQLNKAVSGCSIAWSDTSTGSFYKMDESKAGSSTTLTFYCDKRSPLSGSGTAVIGTLTLPNSAAKAKFSTSGNMKVLDNQLEETVYQTITLRVKGSETNKPSSSSRPSQSESSSSQAARASTLSLNTLTDPRLSAELLERLKKEGIQTELDMGGYRWTIDGNTIGTIPPDRNYYNLEVEALAFRNLSEAAQGSDLVQFETMSDGELPFTAVLHWSVGANHAGRALYLGYYNESSGVLEYRGTATVDEKGVVAFSFNHFSKYVMMTENVWATTAVANSGTSGGAAVLVPPLEQTLAAASNSSAAASSSGTAAPATSAAASAASSSVSRRSSSTPAASSEEQLTQFVVKPKKDTKPTPAYSVGLIVVIVIVVLAMIAGAVFYLLKIKKR